MKVRFAPVYAGIIAAAFAAPALADEAPRDEPLPASTYPAPAPTTSAPAPSAPDQTGDSQGMFSTIASDRDFGDIVGNIIITSEYVYRGLPQSRGAAVQGNADWNAPWGFLLGAWISN